MPKEVKGHSSNSQTKLPPSLVGRVTSPRELGPFIYSVHLVKALSVPPSRGLRSLSIQLLFRAGLWTVFNFYFAV